MSETKSQSAKEIIEDYFKKVKNLPLHVFTHTQFITYTYIFIMNHVKLLSSINFQASDLSTSSDEGRLEATECLAKFSDTEFQRLDRYLRSTEYENKVIVYFSYQRQYWDCTGTIDSKQMPLQIGLRKL